MNKNYIRCMRRRHLYLRIFWLVIVVIIVLTMVGCQSKGVNTGDPETMQLSSATPLPPTATPEPPLQVESDVEREFVPFTIYNFTTLHINPDNLQELIPALHSPTLAEMRQKYPVIQDNLLFQSMDDPGELVHLTIFKITDEQDMAQAEASETEPLRLQLIEDMKPYLTDIPSAESFTLSASMVHHPDMPDGPSAQTIFNFTKLYAGPDQVEALTTVLHSSTLAEMGQQYTVIQANHLLLAMATPGKLVHLTVFKIASEADMAQAAQTKDDPLRLQLIDDMEPYLTAPPEAHSYNLISTMDVAAQSAVKDNETEMITIPFMQPDMDETTASTPQWLRIYYPSSDANLYPAIFIIPGGYPPASYKPFIEEIVKRGYAAVIVRYRTSANPKETYAFPGDQDIACALAWFMANGASYDLDVQKWILFGHTSGGMAAISIPVENVIEGDVLFSECLDPAPARDAVKGVVTFDALVGMPDGALQTYASMWAKTWNIPVLDMIEMVKTLVATPPQDWHEAGLLDENTHNLAKLLPLYWITYPEDIQDTPPYLFLYADDKVPSDFAAENHAMAEYMLTADMNVRLEFLEGTAYENLIMAETDVPAQVTEFIVDFLEEITD